MEQARRDLEHQSKQGWVYWGFGRHHESWNTEERPLECKIRRVFTKCVGKITEQSVDFESLPWTKFLSEKSRTMDRWKATDVSFITPLESHQSKFRSCEILPEKLTATQKQNCTRLKTKTFGQID